MANLHVSRSLKKFCSDIKSARLRRRLPISLCRARRTLHQTLASLENGETRVSVCNVVGVSMLSAWACSSRNCSIRKTILSA